MKTATTLEFRKAVRKVAEKRKLAIYDSYTNQTTVGGDHRTVGFSMPGATDALAAKIERKLNKKGLTAKTRHTDGGGSGALGHFRSGWGSYIRGTCVLA